MSLQLPLAVWGAGRLPPPAAQQPGQLTFLIFNIRLPLLTAGAGDCMQSLAVIFTLNICQAPHHITHLCSAEIFKLTILHIQHSRGGGGEGSTVLGWLCVLTGRLLARWQFSQRGVDMCWPEYPCQHHDTQHTVHLTHTQAAGGIH